VSALSSTTLQERMAGNLRDNNLAFQAAEAALREGEEFLRQAVVPPFNGAGGLLERQDGAGQADFWNSFNWVGNSRAAAQPDGTAAQPAYVIEELPPMPAEGDSLKFGPLSEVAVYRITARGVGGTPDAVSILQTTYRR
jgi:type IV pilus assembly protein PilX